MIKIDDAVLTYLRELYEEDSECSEQDAEEIAEMLSLPINDVVASLERLENEDKVIRDSYEEGSKCRWQAFNPKISISWED